MRHQERNVSEFDEIITYPPSAAPSGEKQVMSCVQAFTAALGFAMSAGWDWLPSMHTLWLRDYIEAVSMPTPFGFFGTLSGSIFFRLCHNKQLINSHFYRGVSELPYKLLFAVIYTHLEFRYEVSHTITSHHVHHFHQTRIPDGTLLDYMVQYRKPLSPQFFLCPKKFLSENNPPHKEFHLRPYIQNNANQQFCFSHLPIQYGSMLYIPS